MVKWYDSNTEKDIIEYEEVCLVENNKQKVLKKDHKLYIKFMERQYVRISVLEDLIHLPKKNELIRLVTQQNFNAFALFLFIVQREDIEDVYMTTYSIDKNTVEGISEILENTEGLRLTLLIASLIKHDKPVLREKMKQLAFKYKGCRFVEAYNHTKIIAVKTKQNYYVIEGSGNLSANARIESYLFDNNKESFLFHKKWIDEILFNMKGTEILHSKKCERIQ